MFTASEKAALDHRLGVPCSLADSLAEEFAEGQVYLAVGELENRLRFGFPIAPENLNECEQAVLRDLVEGSTWVGVHDAGATSASTERRAIKTLESIAKKLEELGYAPLQVPHY